MSDYTFPLQAKTNHPAVIASIEETLRRETEFRNKAREVSERYTGDPLKGWLNGRTYEGQRLSQIQVTEEQYKNLPGRWKQRDHLGRTAPYKNNPVCKEFHVGFKADRIPGRGNILWGSGYMGTGTVFLHDGYVYSLLGFKPQISEKEYSEIAEYGWTEIMASELHLALEAYNASRKAKP